MVSLKMTVFIDIYPQLGKEQSDEVCVVIGIFRVLFHKKKKTNANNIWRKKNRKTKRLLMELLTQ